MLVTRMISLVLLNILLISLVLAADGELFSYPDLDSFLVPTENKTPRNKRPRPSSHEKNSRSRKGGEKKKTRLSAKASQHVGDHEKKQSPKRLRKKPKGREGSGQRKLEEMPSPRLAPPPAPSVLFEYGVGNFNPELVKALNFFPKEVTDDIFRTEPVENPKEKMVFRMDSLEAGEQKPPEFTNNDEVLDSTKGPFFSTRSVYGSPAIKKGTALKGTKSSFGFHITPTQMIFMQGFDFSTQDPREISSLSELQGADPTTGVVVTIIPDETGRSQIAIRVYGEPALTAALFHLTDTGVYRASMVGITDFLVYCQPLASDILIVGPPEKLKIGSSLPPINLPNDLAGELLQYGIVEGWTTVARIATR